MIDWALLGSWAFWIPLLLGVVLSAVLTPVVTELLPANWKFKVRYAGKRIGKLIRPRQVNTSLVTKTSDLANKSLSIDKISNTLRAQIASAGYNPSVNSEGLSFTVQVGNTPSNVIVKMSFYAEKSILDQVEVEIKAVCGYRKFGGHILDLTQTQRRVEQILRKTIPDIDFLPSSLGCELKSLYELTGVLSEYKIGMLTANSKEFKLDMSDDKITVYGTDISNEVASFLTKMITMYY